jgi:hypothetical protein
MNTTDITILIVGAVLFLVNFLVVPILAVMEMNKIMRIGSRAWLDEFFGSDK